MDLKTSLGISASGLRAQSLRMRVIAENLANQDSVADTPGGNPYRRRVASFQSEVDRSTGGLGVKVKAIENDKSDFVKVYQPGHPAADKDGYVMKPNMKAAQRSYEANLNAIEAAKSLTMRTIDLLK